MEATNKAAELTEAANAVKHVSQFARKLIMVGDALSEIASIHQARGEAEARHRDATVLAEGALAKLGQLEQACADATHRAKAIIDNALDVANTRVQTAEKRAQEIMREAADTEAAGKARFRQAKAEDDARHERAVAAMNSELNELKGKREALAQEQLAQIAALREINERLAAARAERDRLLGA